MGEDLLREIKWKEKPYYSEEVVFGFARYIKQNFDEIGKDVWIHKFGIGDEYFTTKQVLDYYIKEIHGT